MRTLTPSKFLASNLLTYLSIGIGTTTADEFFDADRDDAKFSLIRTDGILRSYANLRHN
jgi:hypothetical protein